MSSILSQPRASISSGDSARRLVDAAARWGAYALLWLLLAGAATLWFRHHAMAFRRPLDARGLFLAGVLAAGAAATARLLFRRPCPLAGASPPPGTFSALLSICLVAWGVALSRTAPDPSGMFLLWASLVAEEAWAWSPAGGLARRLASYRHRLGSESSPQEGSPSAASPLPPATKGSDAPESPRILNEPGVLQEFVRRREPTGVELLRGWIRVPFVPGQRNASVHLAFCPPFESTPTLDVVQRFGPEGRIKVVHVLPLGARLDVKLPHASPPGACVILEVVAKSNAG